MRKPSETINDNLSWACLRNIETDPEYAALLETCLSEIASIVTPRTGKMLQKEAYVYISSPNAVTPFHLDPDYNILMQLSGAKEFAVFPADNDNVVAAEVLEKYHHTGLANLPYSEESAMPHAVIHKMTPGDAVYVPLKAPHWVKNGKEISISLSVTWRSEESDHQRRVYLAQQTVAKGRSQSAPLWRCARAGLR